MRVFNQVVFDDFVVGTTPVYTDAAWNALLGLTELVTIQAVVDQVSGAPAITIAQEHSGDNRNFLAKATAPEINAGYLDPRATYTFIGTDSGLIPSAAYVRLRISLSTTDQVHVRITVTGRVHGDVALPKVALELSMRTFNQIVYDDVIEGSGPVLTSSSLLEVLASSDQLAVHVVCDRVLGSSPTISLSFEHSSDGLNFLPLNSFPELSAQALSTRETTSFIVGYSGSPPLAQFLRFRITLGGSSPGAHVRIWATGRKAVPFVWKPSAEPGLKLWLRGDAGVSSASGSVSAWADQSGSGNDALQPTAVNQPTLGAGINARPTIDFDGVNGYLALPSTITGLSGACTVAIVSKLSTPPGSGAFYCALAYVSDASSCGAIFLANTSPYTNTSFRLGYTATNPSVGYNDTLGTAKTTRVFTYNGAGDSVPGNYTSSIDGVAQAVVASSTFTAGADLHAIGSGSGTSPSFLFAGSIGEVLAWDHVLEQRSLEFLDAYLTSRWG